MADQKIYDLLIKLSSDVSGFKGSDIVEKFAATISKSINTIAEEFHGEKIDSRGLEAKLTNLRTIISNFWSEAGDSATKTKDRISGILGISNPLLVEADKIGVAVKKIEDAITATKRPTVGGGGLQQYIKSLKELQDLLAKSVDPELIAKKIQSISQFSPTGGVKNYPNLTKAIQEALDLTVKDVSTVNAERELQTKVKSIFANASKGTDIVIPPISLKNIVTDQGPAGEALRTIHELITTLIGDSLHWDETFKKLFAGDDTQIRNFRDALSLIGPVFEGLTKNQNAFGEKFNTTTDSALQNLILLQKVLENTAQYILGDATALKEEVKAIETLSNELTLIRVAEENLGKQNKRIDTLTASVSNVTTAYGRMEEVFKRAGPDAKIPESAVNYTRFTQTLDKTTQAANKLKSELEEVNKQSKREDGTDRFGVSLNVGLQAALDRIQKLVTALGEVQSKLTTENYSARIDKSFEQTEKAFAEFSKATESSINTIRVNLKQLGSEPFIQGIDSQLMKLDTSLKTTGSLVKGLETAYTSFVNSARANLPTLSVSGVKNTMTEFQTLIQTIREYASVQLLARQAELQEITASKLTAKEKAAQSKVVQTQIADLQTQITTLNQLDKAVISNQKLISQDVTIYNLWKDSAEKAQQAAKDGMNTFVAATALGTRGVNNLVTAYGKLTAETNSSLAVFDSVIRKLQAIDLAGGELPSAFPAISGKSFTSLKELIEYLLEARKLMSEEVKTAGLQVGIDQLKVLDTELSKVKQTAKGALEFPATPTEAVSNYADALARLQTNLKSAATTVSDFTGLQSVYSAHKQALDTLNQSITVVITSLRELKEAGTVELQFGNSLVRIDTLITDFGRARDAVVKDLAEINVGLQKGGASLDTLLKSTGRAQEFSDSFRDLSQRITAANTALAAFNAGAGATATPAAVTQLKSEVEALVRERQALLSDIASAMQRLDSAWQTAAKTVGDQAALAGLEQSLNAIKVQFNGLNAAVSGLDISKLEKTSTPLYQLVEATKQAEVALQGTAHSASTFTTSFDVSVQTLITELSRASGQIGLLKTSFEEKPREVLKSYLQDLNLKAEQLNKAYLEVIKSISTAEMAGGQGVPVNSAAIETARTRAAELREEFQRTAEAARTLHEILARLPEGTDALQVFKGIAVSMQDVRDSGAMLSRGMKSLFDLIAKQNVGAFGNQMGALERQTNMVAAAMRALEDKMVTSLRNMDMMTMGVQMLGQALVEPFKKSVETFSKFSDTLAFIQGATNATVDQLEELGNAAKFMGATTRYSAEQAAEGLKQLALAGYSIEEQMQVLPTVLRLATSAEMELGAATEIVVQVMSSQRMAVDELGKATDIMSAAAIKTTATLSDLGTAFKYAGALSGTLGNEIEDTAGAIALLHNAGMRGSMAGTALRGSLQALLNPTREEAKVLEEVSRKLGGTGLQILNAQGKFVGFVSILKQFETAGLSTADILQLFGQRAGPGMASLLQMGSDKLEDLVKELQNAEGSTARLANTMESTLAGKMQIFANSLESLGESVGESLSLMLKPLADFGTEFVSRVMVIRDALGPLTPIIDNVAVALAGLLAVVGSASLAWSMMLVPTKQLFSFLRTLIVVVVDTAGAMAILATRTATASTAMAAHSLITKEAWAAAVAAGGGFKGLLVVLKSLAIAMVTTPWGIAITALLTIGGLALIFAKNWKSANAELDKQILIVKNTASEFSTLASKINDVSKAIQDIRVTNIGLDANQLMNLQGVKEQKQKLMETLQELVQRYEQSGEAIKKKFRLDKTFDPVTGQLVGLQVISTETGKVISTLSVEMLKGKDAAELFRTETGKLSAAFTQVANAEAARLAVEKFTNSLRENKAFLTQAATLKSASDKEFAFYTERYNSLLDAQMRYNAASADLQDAKVKNDVEAITQANARLKEASKDIERIFAKMGIGFFAGDMDKVINALDGLFGNMERIKAEGARFNQIIREKVSEAIKTMQMMGKQVDADSVAKFVEEAFKNAHGREWMPQWLRNMLGPNAETKAAIEQSVKAQFEDVQAAINQEASKIEVGKAMERNFRDMQRATQAIAKSAEEQLKTIADKMEDLKKVLDIYKDNVDVFVKYREKLTSAAKARMDVGLAAIQQNTQIALTQIQATQAATSSLGTDTFGQLTNAAIGWGAKTKAIDAANFKSFAEFQGQKAKTAEKSATQIYSYYKNSLEKQIDDLERESSVTQNVYSIPVRLVAEEKFSFLDDLATKSVIDLTSSTGEFRDLAKAAETVGYQFKNVYTNIQPAGKAVRTYVADAERWTGELLHYTITFNDDLLNSKVEMEKKKLDITKKGLEEEAQLIDTTYAKQRGLYSENEEARIKLEEEYYTKKKELDTRGMQATQAALDKIKELYKANADKIKKVEEDKQNFINRLNTKRNSIVDATLNESQKLEKEKRRASLLTYQAEQEALQGHLDKAKALYEKAQDAIERMNFEPWDKDSERYAFSMMDRIESGYSEVSDKLGAAGKKEQASLVDTAKQMEETLSKFQASVKDSGDQVTKLAGLLSDILGKDAGKAGIHIDNTEAIDKIKAIERLKHDLDLEFERPLPLKVTVEEAKAELEKLGRDQKELEGAKADAAGRKREAESIQKELDKTNDLLALYRQLELVTKSISSNRLPDNVGLKSTLEDVTKQGTDAAKQYQEIHKAIEDEEKALEKLKDEYVKTGQVVPAALDEQIKKVEEAKKSLQPDNTGKVIISQEVVDVLGAANEKTETANKLTQQFVEELNRIDKTKLEALNQTLTETLERLKKVAEAEAAAQKGRMGGSPQKGGTTSNQAVIDGIEKEQKAREKNTQAQRNETAEKANAGWANVKEHTAIDSVTESTQQATEALQDNSRAAKDAAQQTDNLGTKLEQVPDAAKKAGESVTQVSEEMSEAAKAKLPPFELPIGIDVKPEDIAQLVKAGEDLGVKFITSFNKETNKTDVIRIEPAVEMSPDQKERVGQQIKDLLRSLPASATTIAMGKLDFSANVSDLRSVQSQLNQVLTTARNFGNTGVDMITPAQLKQMKEAKTWLDGLLSDAKSDQVVINVDESKLNGVKNTLNTLQTQSNQTFSDLGEAPKLPDLMAKLKELSAQRAQLQAAAASDPSLVNEAKLAQSTNKIMEVKSALEQLQSQQKQQVNAPIIPIQDIAQASNLSTAIDGLTAKMQNLAAQHPEIDLDPSIITQLEELSAKADEFKTKLKSGEPVKPVDLEAFKTEFESLRQQLQSNPMLKIDTSDINLARGSLQTLQTDMASLNNASVNLKSDTSELKDAISYCDKLVGYDGKRVGIQVVTQFVNQHNQGGLVGVLQMFAKGGLAHIKSFAQGGALTFRRIASSIVPGAGDRDTVPAMLTPGEFVVRKPMVERYGIGFLNAINTGLLQFKEFGGVIDNLPNMALSGLQKYLVPSFNAPAMAAGSGGAIYDVRLHIGEKTVNMKSSRDQVKELVSALKQLDR